MGSFNRPVAGQPLAQVDNPDPFAVPMWRSPVYQTPHVVIWAIQLVRLIWRLVWLVVRHPLPALGCALLVFTWVELGWPALVVLVAFTVTDVAVVYLLWPDWFARYVTAPLRDGRRSSSASGRRARWTW